MATRTFTNGGVNDFASTAGNWDTPPVDDDTIVIAAGSSCCWDIDMSSLVTYPNGIAGLTITSHATTPAKLYFKTSGTTNYLRIKTGTTINGTNAAAKGQLVINSDGAWATTTPYPAAAKATIEFMTTAYLDGTYLTTNVRCANPTNAYIKLSAGEAIGQTALSVDTNVTGDWADGDTISICDIGGAQEHETRVIAAGGIAAGEITVTAGLTAAKLQGAYIVRCNRNIVVIGGSGATQKCIANLAGSGHVFGAWMYCATAGQGYAFDTCVGLEIVGGYYGVGPTSAWANGWSRIFNSCTTTASGVFGASASSNAFMGCTVSITAPAIVVGMATAAFNASLVTISSPAIVGASVYGFYLSTVAITAAAVLSGSTNAFSSCVVSIAAAITSSRNIYVFYQCTVTLSGAAVFSLNGTSTFNLCTASVAGASSSDPTAFRRCPFVNLRDVTLSGAVEFESYNDGWMPPNGYVRWRGVDGTTTAVRDLSKGGVTSSQTASPPTGYTQWLQLVLESATNYGFYQDPFTIMPGETLRIRGVMRIDANQSAYPPRLQIVSQIDDPVLGGSATPLDTMSIPISNGTETGWQDVDVEYKNTATTPIMVFARVVGKHATENVDFAFVVDSDHPATTDVRSGVSFDFGSEGTLEPVTVTVDSIITRTV